MTVLLETFSKGQLAHLIGVSPRYVQRLAEQGVIERLSDNRYPINSPGRYAEYKAKGEAQRLAPTAADRQRTLKADRIEAQLKREDSGVILLEEALTTFDEITWQLLAALDDISGNIGTAGASRTLVAVRARLERKFAERREVLRTGKLPQALP
jgi:hypothetical protein